jgi:hypothetical protein
VFLFDAHCGSCRIVLVPKQYACSLGSQKGTVSVALKDKSEGELRLTEDLRYAEQISQQPKGCSSIPEL